MKNFPLFLALLPLLGCNKQDDTVPSPETFDYFIFGTAAGMCTGNCVTLYKTAYCDLISTTLEQLK